MAGKRSPWLFLGAGLAGLVAYHRVVRPWMFRWGATAAEEQRALPGDDLIPSPWWGWTHAVTISAPAEQVWPWLVQRGYRRGGWYTFDSLYEMMDAADFVDGHSAERIIPELQRMEVGDALPIAPGVDLPVVAVEPGRMLLVHARGNPQAGPNAPFDPDNFMALSWLWYLEPLDGESCRLIDRCRFDYSPSLTNVLSQSILFQPASFVLDRQMLLGIKRRAESNP
jgi:hypothetical protein